MTKICRRCDRNLPLAAYGKNAMTKDGLHYYCKECIHIRYQERRDRIEQERNEQAIIDGKMLATAMAPPPDLELQDIDDPLEIMKRMTNS
jgi:hypothetical protein